MATKKKEVMAENRKDAFKNALSGVHVTAAVKPGFFDDKDDPIASLGQMQRRLKDFVTGTFSQTPGLDPEHLKGLHKIVLHEDNVFGMKAAGAYTQSDSALHINFNHPKLKQTIQIGRAHV